MSNDQLRTIQESIQEELDEREWEAILAKPQAMKKRVEIARKARQDYLDGKTVKDGFGGEASL